MQDVQEIIHKPEVNAQPPRHAPRKNNMWNLREGFVDHHQPPCAHAQYTLGLSVSRQ